MATIVLSQAFSFRDEQRWDWQISKASATELDLFNTIYKQTFDGQFTYDANGIVSGIATDSAFYINDKLVYSVTGMSANATILQAVVESDADDIQIAYALAFAGDDSFTGSSGNDILIGYGGNDSINGGAGIDTVHYQGGRDRYTVTKTVNGVSVVDKQGVNGTDQLSAIERVTFSDGSGLAFDGKGTGGQAYRIYEAAFNRTPDNAGVGYWMSLMDKGVSLAVIASGFVASAEFKTVYGTAPTNAELVGKFYQNILNRPAEKAGFDFWVGALDKGVPLADVLAAISESGENIDLSAAVIAAGFPFTFP